MDGPQVYLCVLAVAAIFANGQAQVLAKDTVVYRPSNSCIIECELTGSLANENAESSWHKDGVAIVNKEKKHVIHDNGSLEILDIDFNEDLGEYVCELKLSNSQVLNATVVVYGQAYVPTFDKSKNLVEDDALNLTCKALGYPIPTVTWLKDDIPINTTDDRTTFTNYKGVVNASVKITKMQFSDAGTYTCEAVNEIKLNGITNSYNATAEINVRVKDKLAALWPFLGICVEVTILCIIIFIYERHRQKKLEEEDAKEEAGHLTNSHSNRDDVRQRKV